MTLIIDLITINVLYKNVQSLMISKKDTMNHPQGTINHMT